MRILIYGYGNPGRQDDGLGIELVNRLEKWTSEKGLPGFTFDNNFQLNIEDAEVISNYDLVIFADASKEDIGDFCFSLVDGVGDLAFTTHAASPGYILRLCKELFQKEPLVLLLHIKGHEWDFQEGLSLQAVENLKNAFAHITAFLEYSDSAIESIDKLKYCE